MVKRLKFLFSTLMMCTLATSSVFAQKTSRPYKGGFVTKDFAELNSLYERCFKYLGVKKGEHVASVGVQCGYIEAEVSAMVDSVHWTLQDIDTTYFNKTNVDKVWLYHEKLKGSPITGDYELVLGKPNQTNLNKNAYDRIIMLNVYHEIIDRESIMSDIKVALKPGGTLVIMERMGKKPGKSHGDCGKPELWEPDFLDEMQRFQYNMVNKLTPEKKMPITFYTFNKI